MNQQKVINDILLFKQFKYKGIRLDEKFVNDMLLFKKVLDFKKQKKIKETNLAKLIKLYKENHD